ncbi:MAG: zf-TFIIB domain-containing protein [Acidobacteriota bacterium]
MIDRPSDKEQEYFIRLEVERLKKLREEHQRAAVEADRRRLRELHHLHCAKCGQKMETTRLGSVEVEICPDCGGMYLDAGELDKLADDKRRGPFSSALASVRRIWAD